MIKKLFGAGIGWAVGGPIGAIVGMAIGSMFESGNATTKTGQRSNHTQQGDFNVSLIVLSAAVMKADGKILKSELDFVKRFFIQNFGNEIAQEQIELLREVLKQELNITEICGQINQQMRITEKRLIMQYLFGIAKADGHVHPNEINVIQTIASYIGISASEFLSMKAMNTGRETNENDYDILGIKSDISDSDLKKTYRKLVVKHHPDKVAHLGNNHVASAKSKFQKIQKAYENIKKDRGL